MSGNTSPSLETWVAWYHSAVSLPSPLMGGVRLPSLGGCLCVHSLTYKLTEVTVDQMDPDADGLIKWSVIRPPTLADISCEG